MRCYEYRRLERTMDDYFRQVRTLASYRSVPLVTGSGTVDAAPSAVVEDSHVDGELTVGANSTVRGVVVPKSCALHVGENCSLVHAWLNNGAAIEIGGGTLAFQLNLSGVKGRIAGSRLSELSVLAPGASLDLDRCTAIGVEVCNRGGLTAMPGCLLSGCVFCTSGAWNFGSDCVLCGPGSVSELRNQIEQRELAELAVHSFQIGELESRIRLDILSGYRVEVGCGAVIQASVKLLAVGTVRIGRNFRLFSRTAPEASMNLDAASVTIGNDVLWELFDAESGYSHTGFTPGAWGELMVPSGVNVLQTRDRVHCAWCRQTGVPGYKMVL